MEGERTLLSPVLRPVERGIYRVCGVDETAEQDWKGYAFAVLAMALVAMMPGYVVLRLQDVLPLNPAAIAPMSSRTWPSTRRSASRATRTGRTTQGEDRRYSCLSSAGGAPSRQLHVGRRGPRGRHCPHPRPDPA